MMGAVLCQFDSSTGLQRLLSMETKELCLRHGISEAT